MSEKIKVRKTEGLPGALSQLELDPITTKPKTAIKQEAYIFE
jgi:hypothetical protein